MYIFSKSALIEPPACFIYYHSPEPLFASINFEYSAQEWIVLTLKNSSEIFSLFCHLQSFPFEILRGGLTGRSTE